MFGQELHNSIDSNSNRELTYVLVYCELSSNRSTNQMNLFVGHYRWKAFEYWRQMGLKCRTTLDVSTKGVHMTAQMSLFITISDTNVNSFRWLIVQLFVSLHYFVHIVYS